MKIELPRRTRLNLCDRAEALSIFGIVPRLIRSLNLNKVISDSKISGEFPVKFRMELVSG
jgi:hypothetical protein